MVLAPLLLAAPLLLLAAAVVALAAHGPVGWVAAALLLVVVGWAGRTCWRWSCRWWASTRAPELPGHHRPVRVQHLPRERR
jgi:hypothetical protein